MEVHFYEKPGCINNTKQKKLLDLNGHTVFAHSLLDTPWTKEKLRAFFGNLPVNNWFNPAAPRIKSGEVNPTDFDENSALEAMLKDPLLIRRPLIEAEGEKVCGFENPLVERLINKADVSGMIKCPNSNTGNNCN